MSQDVLHGCSLHHVLEEHKPTKKIQPPQLAILRAWDIHTVGGGKKGGDEEEEGEGDGGG